MTGSSGLFKTALLLGLYLWAAAPALAQQHRSSLRGTLLGAGREPAGSVRFRIINETTRESRSFSSDAEGRFVITQLEPGNYLVESDDDRFRGAVVRLTVSLNEDAVVMLPLASVSISDDVDHRPFFLIIDRQSPALRTRLDGTFLADLPLDGRSLFDAILLTPGTRGTERGPLGAGLFTTYFVDGFANQQAYPGLPAVEQQLEAVAGLEVATPQFDAAFSGAGAHVNVVTRSGGNDRSGGAFALFQTELNRQQLGAFGGGPLARDRSFFFADLQQTRFGDAVPGRSSGTNAGLRIDQRVGNGGRLTARYGLSDGVIFARNAHQAGASLLLPLGSAANDFRVGLTRVDFDDPSRHGWLGGDTYQVSDVFSWGLGSHAASVGGAWHASEVELAETYDTSTIAAFVQDEWQASPSLSVSGGLRYERVSRGADLPSEGHVMPRAGFAWSFGREMGMAVRGGYGRFHDLTAFPHLSGATDQWNVGFARQWSRTRTVEVGYQGARFEDRSGGYNAFVFEMEQRSEVGLTGHLTYSYSRWGNTLERVLGPIFPGHKITGAFTSWLPIGDGRQVLGKGLAGEILADLQLSGVFGIQSGRGFGNDAGRESTLRTLDLALMKSLSVSDRATLQVRFETYNLMNRGNPDRRMFRPELLNEFGPDNAGRRYQFGGRVLF